MALAGNIGASVTDLDGHDPILTFFGEDQGRYLVTLALDPQGDEIAALWSQAKSQGIEAPWIGNTGGTDLILGSARPLPLETLRTAHEGWFPTYMQA
jgi:phosphoribosylformylglycinamidine synthase subunit PurL